MGLDPSRFKDQLRDAVELHNPGTAPPVPTTSGTDLRVVAWYDHGGINFDMRTQDCAIPHLLVVSKMLMEQAENLMMSRALKRQPAEEQEQVVTLSPEEELRLAPDDVLILCTRDASGHWDIQTHQCAQPQPEHIAWVAYVLGRIVEEEASNIVAAARGAAQPRQVPNRMG